MRKLLVVALAVGMSAAWFGAARAAGVPDDAKGFAGMIEGKVVAKGEKGVVVSVTKVLRTWRHNEAKRAESLVGKEVEVRVGPKARENVKKFVALLKVGDTESFDVRNREGDGLEFLELTEVQRKRVEEAE